MWQRWAGGRGWGSVGGKWDWGRGSVGGLGGEEGVGLGRRARTGGFFGGVHQQPLCLFHLRDGGPRETPLTCSQVWS